MGSVLRGLSEVTTQHVATLGSQPAPATGADLLTLVPMAAANLPQLDTCPHVSQRACTLFYCMKIGADIFSPVLPTKHHEKPWSSRTKQTWEASGRCRGSRGIKASWCLQRKIIEFWSGPSSKWVYSILLPFWSKQKSIARITEISFLASSNGWETGSKSRSHFPSMSTCSLR